VGQYSWTQPAGSADDRRNASEGRTAASLQQKGLFRAVSGAPKVA